MSAGDKRKHDDQVDGNAAPMKKSKYVLPEAPVLTGSKDEDDKATAAYEKEKRRVLKAMEEEQHEGKDMSSNLTGEGKEKAYQLLDMDPEKFEPVSKKKGPQPGKGNAQNQRWFDIVYNKQRQFSIEWKGWINRDIGPSQKGGMKVWMTCDPAEDLKWRQIARNLKLKVIALAAADKWEEWSQSIMQLNPIVSLANPRDEKLREEWKNEPEKIPEDGWDPVSKSFIDCFPSSINSKITAKSIPTDLQARRLNWNVDFKDRIPVMQMSKLSSGYYFRVAKSETPGAKKTKGWGFRHECQTLVKLSNVPKPKEFGGASNATLSVFLNGIPAASTMTTNGDTAAAPAASASSGPKVRNLGGGGGGGANKQAVQAPEVPNSGPVVLLPAAIVAAIPVPAPAAAAEPLAPAAKALVVQDNEVIPGAAAAPAAPAAAAPAPAAPAPAPANAVPPAQVQAQPQAQAEKDKADFMVKQPVKRRV